MRQSAVLAPRACTDLSRFTAAEKYAMPVKKPATASAESSKEGKKKEVEVLVID